MLLIAIDDLIAVGMKVTEMADRAKAMHAVVPGAQAKWVLEIDDIRFNVVVSIAPE